jgi:predicted transposase YbfD/YdcC
MVCVKKNELGLIREHFESLPDPRNTRNRRHLLGDIIVIAVCGVIVGCEGPTAIERWAKAKKDWLCEILELPGGIPSRDCMRRVLSALKPDAFQKCFERWIAACLTRVEEHDERADDEASRIIAIDGKTLRRSHNRAADLGPLHLVSAWATEYGLTLGQVATEEKSNEITAIPALIEQIDVKGAIVTIDAMGCQKAIAQQIVREGGDYVLAVKDNQPKLHETLIAFFGELEKEGAIEASQRKYETHEKGHGRLESRYYCLAKLPPNFHLAASWPSVAALGMAVRVFRRSEGSETRDVRYFIASDYLSGKRFAQAVRGHWGIENSLHWVLDVTFAEDQSRARERRLADNLSWLRRFAISMLKQHPSKDSIKGKMQIAGWNNAFLTQVLASKAT